MGCVASRDGELPLMAEHEERLTAHSGYRQAESYPEGAAETPLGSPAVWECHSTLVPRALRDVEAVGMASLFTEVSINQDGLTMELHRKRGCPQVGGTHVGHVYHFSGGISSL